MNTDHLLADVPQGLGVYCGRGGVSASRARELRAAGIRHVVLCAEAVDGWRAGPAQLSAQASAVRSAGLVPHVYAFPGLSRARQPRAVAADLLGAVRRAGGVCPVPDLEAPYRGRPALLRALLDALVELGTRDERERILVTTLGLPSDRGTRWPWPELHAWLAAARAATGCTLGAIGWQCYERAADAPRVRAGVDELARTWGRARTLPHVATYRRTSERPEGQDGAARLVADLDRACLGPDGRPDVPGAWLWSAASLDDDELDALRAWAERHGW